MTWTLDDVPDLQGKRIVVTGANTGLGFEAARILACKGAEVVMACRNPGKAAEAVARIDALSPSGSVEAMALDLASLASVRRFAAALGERWDHLDRLINNAGIMMVPYATTEDGFESQLGVNHLGHFALTGLLLDRLLAADGARVVNVSSNGHRMGRMDFDDLMFAGGGGYSPARAYGRSKLANLLFTFELQRRFEAAGASAIATVAHPGGADTDLARHMQDRWYFKLLKPVVYALFIQSAEMGTLPTIRAATEPGLKGGEYFGPNGFQQIKGPPVPVGCSAAARDADSARQLWEASEQLTGVAFALPG